MDRDSDTMRRVVKAWVIGLAVFGLVGVVSVISALNRIGVDGWFPEREDAFLGAGFTTVFVGGTLGILVGLVIWTRSE